MARYEWPQPSERRVIGKRISRLDGPVKSAGRAQYSSDVRRAGMLYGKVLTCPHGHARVKSIDVEPARRIPGVKAIRVVQKAGDEIHWAGDEIAFVAAEREEIAADAVRAIRVEYELLPHVLDIEDPARVPNGRATPTADEVVGDPDQAFKAAEVVAEGTYGCPIITHCCLEPHGQVAEWEGDKLTLWASTQNVSGLAEQFAQPLRIPATDIRVIAEHVGGGFGSKFAADRWGIEAARMAKETGRPVKLMLDRDHELQSAGLRPSAYGRVKLGARKDGTLVAWESTTWGTGGIQGTGSPPMPYVVRAENRRHKHISFNTNVGPARAWRAPPHPQAALITMCALEDLAAALEMDPLDFFLKNADKAGERASVYRDELQIAARLSDWKKLWQPRRVNARGGPVRRGLGLSMHTWGGRGHRSMCEVQLHPDGSVEAKLASQDIGTGTRTVVAIVLAETLGLELGAVKVSLGDTTYPPSGASGGSTTVGGVSASTRRAAVDVREQLFAKVAAALGVDAADLEAAGGQIRSRKDPARRLAWKDACAKLGVSPVSAVGRHPGIDTLDSSGVGGVQVADVTVDVETGLVKVNRMVAVQDCGLIIDLKTAESQVFGALIMGVTYALFEEQVTDPVSGAVLNADMEFYKLAGIADTGNFVVHFMTGAGYDDRGVIGLGEPPVISPGAAISNAVANALGVRVPFLPLTPRRVLDTLEKRGVG